MIDPARFPFTNADPDQGEAGLMPILPLVLRNGTEEISVSGLMDTGSAVNVLPYSVGVNLGFVWEQQNTPIVLTGNLARYPARGIVVSASVGHFTPVRLVFASSQPDDIRLILGQANFFMEFDVCFFRTRGIFEVAPKTG